MSSYELFLFLHIAAVVIWLGAGFTFFLLVIRVQRSRDPAQERLLTDANNWLAPRLFIPASLATFIFGVALVLDGPWSFGDLWITLGLTGYAISFLIGIAFLKPEGERLARAIADRGPQSSEARRHIARLTTVGRVELTILFLVAADMVLKPTGDDTGTLVAFAAIVVAAAVIAMRTSPKPAPTSPASAPTAE